MTRKITKMTIIAATNQLELCKEQHDYYTKRAVSAARDGQSLDVIRTNYETADAWWLRYLEAKQTLKVLNNQLKEQK